MFFEAQVQRQGREALMKNGRLFYSLEGGFKKIRLRYDLLEIGERLSFGCRENDPWV
jgi:hypothetical protein